MIIKNKLVVLALIIVLLLVVLMRYFYVETASFPVRVSTPVYSEDRLELVADLPYPPGNLAVTDDGQVYFTFHPEAKPPFNLAKLVAGKAVPWPSNESYQRAGIKPVKNAYSVRIDSQRHAWVLDNKPARLVEYDLNSDQFVQEYIFSEQVFGWLAHANDFQISPDNRFIYISVDGLFDKQPGLVVYDIEKRRAWKRLFNHKTTIAGDYQPVVQQRPMTVFGLFTVNPGVDGIALSRDGQWLYYATFSGEKLYRVNAHKLADPQLSEQQLEPYIQLVGNKTMTDGMTTDLAGNIYLSDIENSAVVRMTPKGAMETLIQSQKLRWPDGFSYGDDDWLYVTCSSLHQVIGVWDFKQYAPFQIYRFKSGIESIAGQ